MMVLEVHAGTGSSCWYGCIDKYPKSVTTLDIVVYF